MRDLNRQRITKKSPSGEQLHSLPASLCRTESEKGFSLVEMLIALTIFSIVTAGAFSAYLSQIKHSTREYSLAESDVELGIVKNILIRDLELGGYGIAENYADASPALAANILAFSGTEGTTGNSDFLKLRGTALGMDNRAAQGWSYVTNQLSPTTFATWGDAREDLQNDDAVILIEPTAKQLLVEGVAAKNWLFTYNGTPANLTPVPTTLPAVGTLVYGLGASDATQPFNTVRYYLGGTPPAGCAPGTDSLLRAESNKTDTPDGNLAQPLLACVRSFQVAFGLDTDENGTINDWDDGGVIANAYTAVQQRRRLKQIRVFVLVQSGNRDTEMTLSPATIRVGDTLAGQDITLTAAQRQYRWRLVTVSVTPRNLR